MVNALQAPIGQATETGYAIHRKFIAETTAAAIVSEFLPHKGEHQLVLDYPDIFGTSLEDTISGIQDSYRHFGFPEWSANRIFLRRTELGTPRHRDHPYLRYGTALLYLDGENKLEVSKHSGSAPQLLVFNPGDLFLQRGPAHYVTDEERSLSGLDDGRMWHAAPYGLGDRSFLHIGFESHREVAQDIRTRQAVFVD